MSITLEKENTCKVLEEFLEGAGEEWDFDDWISIPSKFDEIEKIKSRVWEIAKGYPDKIDGGFCNEIGTAKIREIIASLKKDIAQGSHVGKLR